MHVFLSIARTSLAILSTTSQPAPDPAVVIEDALAYGFTASGEALQSAWPAAGEEVDESLLRARLADAAGAAASAFADASAIIADGLSPSDPALPLFGPRVDAVATAFAELSSAVEGEDYDGIHAQLDALRIECGWLSSSLDVLLGQPTVASHVDAAIDALENLESSYALIAPSFSRTQTHDQLKAVAEASFWSSADLTQLRDDAFAITDPNIINLAGFNDVGLVMAAWNMVTLVGDPGYQTWADSLASDTDHWMEELVLYCSTPAVVACGDALLAAGSGLDSGTGTDTILIPGCEDECGPGHGACPNACDLCESGVGVGMNNPDDCKKINALLDLLALLPDAIPTPSVIPAPLSHLFSFPTSADPKDVTDAMKALMATLKSREPQLWIKVCWDECTEHRCGFFWHLTEQRCDHKKSEWILVPAPMDIGGQWPPLKSWSSGSVPGLIAAAVQAAVTTACAGH